MKKQKVRPQIGVGVYIFNEKGALLLGLRKGAHAPDTWCPPGGHLEIGEQPEETAIRETREEAGIEIKNIREIGFTNDIYSVEKHYVTLQLSAVYASGEVQVMEPDKCKEWKWFDLDHLPNPLMLSVSNAIEKHRLLKRQ